MIFKPPTDQRFARLIDANLDRAREGLRVIEDWCRFELERKDLVLKLKDCRQQLGSHHHEIYKKARSVSTDQGALLNHSAQNQRVNPTSIISANCSRVQEALRVLEEFTRSSNPQLSKNAATIRYEIYELEITLIKAINKNKRIQKLNETNLCLITAQTQKSLKTISSALLEGVNMVQYRHKNFNYKKDLKQVQDLSLLCKEHGALLIINDNVDLALAVNADGVHLGQEDMPTELARNLLGGDLIIGKSTHSIEHLKKAQQESCDYVGIGPVFPSKTKPEAKPLDNKNLLEMYSIVHLPCFAIGGINTSNVSNLTSQGIQRIAVIDAIMNTQDPALATRKLLGQLQ
tara:strand:+ start:6442 stop:7479 length:1038 start_codon:yes stop_codon:yes gene_type:complete